MVDIRSGALLSDVGMISGADKLWQNKIGKKIIRVLVTEREHREIKAAAELGALPTASYVRAAALEKARKDTRDMRR